MAKHQKKRITSLLNYIKNSPDIDEVAVRIGTTVSNLVQIGYGGSVSAKLAVKINQETKQAVSKTELRPDIFA